MDEQSIWPMAIGPLQIPDVYCVWYNFMEKKTLYYAQGRVAVVGKTSKTSAK